MAMFDIKHYKRKAVIYFMLSFLSINIYCPDIKFKPKNNI